MELLILYNGFINAENSYLLSLKNEIFDCIYICTYVLNIY